MRKNQPRTAKQKEKARFSPEVMREIAKSLQKKRRKLPSLGPWVWLPRKIGELSYHIWNSVEYLPNLPDYDPIIIVSPESHDKTIQRNMDYLRFQIPHLVRAGRTVIWIMTPIKQISEAPFFMTKLPIFNHSWWPGFVNVIQTGKGKLMHLNKIKAKEFKPYLDKIKSWDLVLKALIIGNYRKWHCFLTDPAGQCLAAEVPVENGRIVALPPIPGQSYEAMVTTLLREVFAPEKLPPPSWVQTTSLLLPGENALCKQLEEINQQIEGLEAKYSQLELERATLDNFRCILYETGPNLEGAIRLALKTMGLTIKELVDRGKEDLIIETSRGEIYAEIKERGKGLNLQMLRQLAQWKDDALIEEEKTVKAVLILNHQRNKPPAERDALIPPNVAEFLRNREIGLLWCTNLFKGLQKVLQGDITTIDIEKALYETVGECTFETVTRG